MQKKTQSSPSVCVCGIFFTLRIIYQITQKAPLFEVSLTSEAKIVQDE